MILVDTHTHLYLDEFSGDREAVISNAINNDVRYMLLPNVDSSTIKEMLLLADKFKSNCLPIIGLHPSSVFANYESELIIVDEWLSKRKFYGIGETGIDLYWDKTFLTQQKLSFKHHIERSIKHKLPIIIHSRNSFPEIFDTLEENYDKNLKGIFHCFSGNIKDAEKAIQMGFHLGIGGVVTFKNSGLEKVVGQIDLKHIVLETDSPYLAPVPYRGKRNESSYIKLIAQKIAEIKKIDIQQVAEETTNNAIELFSLKTF